MGCRKVKTPTRVLKRKNVRMKRRNSISREQDNEYELLYAVTQSNRDCKIENVAQVSTKKDDNNNNNNLEFDSVIN